MYVVNVASLNNFFYLVTSQGFPNNAILVSFLFLWSVIHSLCMVVSITYVLGSSKVRLRSRLTPEQRLPNQYRLTKNETELNSSQHPQSKDKH
jgi:hypothetical protein